MPSVTADSKNCWPFQLPFAFAAHFTTHLCSKFTCRRPNVHHITPSSSSSTNFIATQVLNKTSGPLCVTCYTSVNATVAGSVRWTVPSSVCTWIPPVTTVTWSPVAACYRLLLRQRGRHDRRWSCATTVEHAATVTMQIADAYATRCRWPVVLCNN